MSGKLYRDVQGGTVAPSSSSRA
ncbi:colicin release lysis protein [Klebsiella pneumoniae]